MSIKGVSSGSGSLARNASAPTVFDILSGGSSLFVDLLTELPASSDVGTWQFPTWPGYEGQYASPEIQVIQVDNYYCRVEVDFPLAPGQWDKIKAVGLSYQGQGVVLAPALGQFNSGVLVIEYLVQPLVTVP